jgi:hypothetical protein
MIDDLLRGSRWSSATGLQPLGHLVPHLAALVGVGLVCGLAAKVDLVDRREAPHSAELAAR